MKFKINLKMKKKRLRKMNNSLMWLKLLCNKNKKNNKKNNKNSNKKNNNKLQM